ncbi:dihydrodipicolinate synthase family protein [Shigella flexneri]
MTATWRRVIWRDAANWPQPVTLMRPRINQRLMPLHNKLFVEPNPIPVKWACKELGLEATDTMRLPMTPITDLVVSRRGGTEACRFAVKFREI